MVAALAILLFKKDSVHFTIAVALVVLVVLVVAGIAVAMRGV
jgi:hypothetical protein